MPRRPRRWWPAATATLLTCALVAAACHDGGARVSAPTTTVRDTTSTAAAETTTTSAGAPVPAIAWHDCGELQCGGIDVPLDWTEPAGPTVALALVKAPAAKPSERIGTLLVNNGGPGGSPVEFVKQGFRFTDAISDRFDLVGFDPRGVGGSSPLRCGDNVDAFLAADSGPDTADEQADLDTKAKAVADECGAEDEPLLAHVDTDDVVRDMEAIRHALGEQTISFYGFSYGTFLGERYAELYPHNLRALVLDGVVDPSADFAGFLRAQTVALEKTSQDMFAACDADPSCPVHGGAAAAYDRVAARVEQQPLPADDGAVGPSDLATGIIGATYEPGLWSEFYDALADADAGDGTAMLGLASGYRSLAGFTIYVGVECADLPHPIGAADFAAFAADLEGISPRLGGAVANELLPCAFWPVPTTGVPADVRAAGAPPVLVIGNTGDAATPYEQAVKVAGTLADGHLLTYTGQGHSSYFMSQCVQRAVEAYLVDMTVPAEGANC
jgi:pimeloyl-ACP methyl ester carboxylesterase